MANGKMVVEIEDVRFEKYPNGSTVNIYVDGIEVDVFTDYNIGADFNKFEEACEEHFKYMMENN